MRSAWSPTRSMSFETFLVVWPKFLLALPTVFAIDLTSRSGRLALLQRPGHRHAEHGLAAHAAPEEQAAGHLAAVALPPRPVPGLGRRLLERPDDLVVAWLVRLFWLVRL